MPNKLSDFRRLSDHARFAILMTLFAFAFGIYLYTIPIAAEHIYFYISAPIATYFPSYLLWKIFLKNKKDYTIGNIIGLSIALTIIVHYLNFVILDIGRLIGSIFFKNVESESLFGILTYLSWIRMTVSLYLVGIPTCLLFILVGMYIIKTTRNLK